MKFIIGIDLGGTSAKLALFTEDLEAIKMWQVATSSEDHGWKIVPNIEGPAGRNFEARLRFVGLSGDWYGITRSY